MDRADLARDLDDHVTRLVDGWTHTELVNGRIRRLKVTGLIRQLREGLTPLGGTPDEDSPQSIPDSRPPVPDEPFAVLLAIGRAVKGFRVAYSISRSQDADVLRALNGILPGLDDAAALTLVTDIGVLVQRAEVATSWRLHHRRLRGCCPDCGRNGTVMVRIDDFGPQDAFCVSCGTEWPRGSLGILAGALDAPRPS